MTRSPVSHKIFPFAIFLCAVCVTAVNSSSAAAPDFNKDIRPILAENCFACHGFDEKARKAKLRLDLRDSAISKKAIVPDHPEQSELVKRILTADPDDHMPPPDSGKKLSPKQIDTLKSWIAAGAPYAGHWAFQPILKPAIPAIRNGKFEIRNPIDNFILARLENDNLHPSPPASKEMLIRRVTFDLTGLPPTPAEIDAFLADNSPEAYDKVVDRLLANPHFGERMAMDWLDAARYADTHGYHIDSGRDMTAWREWVIDAFNKNLPFDQFTIQQLAGDLLPNATTDTRIASGFHRNHMINFEGGAIPEEYRTAYLIDRVNTTSMVWLGLTLNCCQCHDHKYDPFTQKEYYQLYAFFNNVPENGLDGAKGNAKPFIKTPSHDQLQKIQTIAARVAELEKSLDGPLPASDAAQAKWEETALRTSRTVWTLIDPAEVKSKAGATFAPLEDHSLRVGGVNAPVDSYTLMLPPAPASGTTAIRFEALTDDGLKAKGPGRSVNGNFVMTEVKLFAADQVKPLKLKAASADFAQKDFPASNAIDINNTTGWAIDPAEGKAHHLIVELEQPLPAGTQVRAVFEFNSTFASHQPGRIRLAITNSPNPHGAATLPDVVVSALNAPAEKRSAAQRAELARYYRSHFVAAFKDTRDQIAALQKERSAIESSERTTMVMEEMASPRDTFLLLRGQYDKKGEKLIAGTPAALHPMKGYGKLEVRSEKREGPAPVVSSPLSVAGGRPSAQSATDNGQRTTDNPRNSDQSAIRNPQSAMPPTRLDLARWIASAENPLTARVIVNRYWQAYFGIGIVKTVEDFGTQGEWPTHPDLLDFLARRFIDSGWDVKAMQRLIVTSATYRQSSAVTPDLVARDPENRLLARGPRFRLPAEFIRDQALAISGLLNSEIGGHSVSPYQPAGLWEELMSRADGANWTAQTYTQSHGPDLYRRTMYTFWKRTSPPPTLSTFDAPDREVCTVRRSRTNTPLQALVLLNDPTYLEASRKLAERIMTEIPDDPGQRIAFAFRMATARAPTAPELDVLRRAYQRQSSRYKTEPAAAEKLLKIGEAPVNEKLDKSELAAWTMVVSVILNMDETVTRN